MNSELEWEPFVINKEQYRDLVENLKKSGFKEERIPSKVDDYYSWVAWQFEYMFGVPRTEHLQSLLEEKDILEQVRLAEESDNKNKLKELFIEEFNITTKIQDFMEPYLDTEV